MENQTYDKKVTFRVSNEERENYKKVMKLHGTTIQETLREFVLDILEQHRGELENGN